MKRALLSTAGLILVASGTAACGGGAPTDASVEDFCTSYAKVVSVKDGGDFHDWADEMEETGTPKDFTDEQREGFELVIKVANDADEDATEEELQDLETDLSDKDQEKADALTDYVTDNCKDQLQDQMKDQMPDVEVPDAN